MILHCWRQLELASKDTTFFPQKCGRQLLRDIVPWPGINDDLNEGAYHCKERPRFLSPPQKNADLLYRAGVPTQVYYERRPGRGHSDPNRFLYLSSMLAYKKNLRRLLTEPPVAVVALSPYPYLLDLLSGNELRLPLLPKLVQVVLIHVVQLGQFGVLRRDGTFIPCSAKISYMSIVRIPTLILALTSSRVATEVAPP